MVIAARNGERPCYKISGGAPTMPVGCQVPVVAEGSAIAIREWRVAVAVAPVEEVGR